MVQYAALLRDSGIDIAVQFCVGTYVGIARTTLATEALNAGGTHILFLDSDMRFPPDLLWRLLQHQEPIVGVNYTTRGSPIKFVATRGEYPDREPVPTTAESSGLEAVDVIGFGGVLIRADVFHKIGDPRKWFYTGQGERSGGGFVGEDVHFCREAQTAGFTILIDHDTSREIGHVGSFTYRWDMVPEAGTAETADVSSAA